MLHLPLEHPRGLLQKTPRKRADGQWTVMYAYPFTGSHKLSIEPSKGHGRPDRPREILPAKMFEELRREGVIRMIWDYDHRHGQGEAMRRRPTFALQKEMELV